MKFSKAANLTLIDFDPKWDDMPQVIGIVKEKLIKDGGMHINCCILNKSTKPYSFNLKYLTS